MSTNTKATDVDRSIHPTTEALRMIAASLRTAAKMTLGKSITLVLHNVGQRIVEGQATVERRDVAVVSHDVNAAIATLGPLPKGIQIHLRDQSESLFASSRSLVFGVIIASLLVYLLPATLYQ